MKIGIRIRSWTNEIKKHKGIYFLLFLILIAAFFVRTYRTSTLSGFYYDQGRDALVIWKLWHEGKLFLIGPVTGLAGIFLGPLYYYLISPFYLIGKGDPVVPAIFLASLSTLAVYMLYFLGKDMHSREAGIFASVIGGFSYYIVLTSRWLSNPNPVLLTSLLFLWSLWEIASNGRRYWWIIAALLAGISLQFESASAIFYIPLMGVFFIWQLRNFPGFKILLASVCAFFATLLPQIIFNFRHENILFNNFSKLFFEDKGFRAITKFMVDIRSEFFWNVFHQKIFPGGEVYSVIFFIVLAATMFVHRRRMRKPIIPLFSIFLVTPIVGYLFFQGNYTVVYDYYMAGYYLPFVLLFGIGLAELWRSKTGLITVSLFFSMFLLFNGTLLKNFLTDKVDGPTDIYLPAQLSAVDWVFENAKEEFNVDVYVPPVIPYAYDYLFLWRSTKRCGENLCGMVQERQVPQLFTLYEQDPPHPERLEAWLARQAGIGRVEEEAVFAGITVQRRIRL